MLTNVALTRRTSTWQCSDAGLAALRPCGFLVLCVPVGRNYEFRGVVGELLPGRGGVVS